jgi:hypothetical protein
MTAKEKARELVDMHINPFNYTGCPHPVHTLFESTAKQCALNTVDQMMLVLPFTDKHKGLNEYAIHMQKYLEQVRNEIHKL